MRAFYFVRILLLSSTLVSAPTFALVLTEADDNSLNPTVQDNPNLSTSPTAPNSQLMSPNTTDVSPPATSGPQMVPPDNMNVPPPAVPNNQVMLPNNMNVPSSAAPNQMMSPNNMNVPPPATPNNQMMPPNNTNVPPPANNQMMAPPNATPMTPPSNNMMQPPPDQLPPPTIGTAPQTTTAPDNRLPLPTNTEGQPTSVPPSGPAMSPQSKNDLDQNIVAQIKMSMATNNDLSDTHVKVTSEDAVVHMTGKVNNYIEANALIIIAESIPGVKDVDISKLKLINGTAHLSKDAVISAKIKGSFVREQLFTEGSLTPIKVITFNGVVTLIGKVSDQKQALNAMNIARSIDGVNTVKSEIRVQ